VVKILRVAPGADDVIGVRKTEPSGWWSKKRPHADGTFYVSIARAERRLPDGAPVVCGAVRSKRFTRNVPAPAAPGPGPGVRGSSQSITAGDSNEADYVPPAPTPPVDPPDPNDIDPGKTVTGAIQRGIDLW
jgi:hypothetical protein